MTIPNSVTSIGEFAFGYKNGGYYGVGVTCTRAQIITFLYKAFMLPT